MIVHKSAAVTKVDGEFRFVLSDASVDRMGDVIEPTGWQFDAYVPALFNHGKQDPIPIGSWSDIRLKNGRLEGKLNFLEQGLSPRVDEYRALLEHGHLLGASVGFSDIESEPLPDRRGKRYKKQRLLECSLVTIPANANAQAIAKSLNISDDTLNFVFGEQATEGDGMVRRHIGEPAGTSPARRAGSMTTLSTRIENAQNNINADRDALSVLLSQAEPDTMKMSELNERIEQRHAELAEYRRSEVLLGQSTTPAAPAAVQKAAPLSGQLYPPGVPIPARVFATPRSPDVKPEDLWVKAAVAYITAQGTGKDIETALAMRGYADHEGLSLFTKAAVAGATTTQAGWAAELFQTGTSAFIETLRQTSVYPALAAAGGGRLTFGPQQGNIKLPSRASTPSIAGSFVGEGAPIPVRKLGLTSITLAPKKMGVITVMSREIARYSNPAIEPLVKAEIIEDTATTLDSLLLDATIGDAIRPAGLLYNVSALTATAGGGYAAMLGDLRKLRAPFDAANAGRRMVLLVNPAQQLSFTMTPGPDGSMNWTGGILGAYQVISSNAIPVGRVIMIDAADFVTATGDVPEFELSDQALLHMEDTTPLQIVTGAQGAGVVAAPSQSMFQTAQIAIRMLLDVSWAMRRTGMVQFINSVTW